MAKFKKSKQTCQSKVSRKHKQYRYRPPRRNVIRRLLRKLKQQKG